MSSQIFVDFKPAEIHDVPSCTTIVFYAKNPSTGLLERQRVKLNHIHDKRERLKYGRMMVQQINRQLYEGWNPIVEKSGFSKLVTVAEAVNLYKKSYTGNRSDSIRTYDSMLKSFTDFCTLYNMCDKPVYEFGLQWAQRYMLHVENRDVGSKTYNNYIRFMCQFMNYCIDRGLVKDNPFSSIKLKRVDEKKRTVIPPEVRAKISDYLVREKMDGFRLICLLTYYCLIRPKELLMLKVSYISMRNNLIIIPAEVAKNHCERQISMPTEIAILMADHIKSATTDLYLFSDDYRPGKKMKTTRDTGRTWSNMRKAIGLPSTYQFYSLKDTGITEMLEAGVPAKMVQELADHHSLEMTQKYVGKSHAEDIRRKCAVLNF
jgi:integrase